MATDFESIEMIRGPKLSDLAEHVKDVLAIALAPDDEYQVGTLALSSYDFVPYALSGLSAAMQTPSTGVRASTLITVPLSDDVGGVGKAEQIVTLFGPGDVLDVDPGQIVRRYPAPGSVNAEETFHAHIEFDRPELPWSFSAHTPGAQMLPWLTLVVLERDEVDWEPLHNGLQPIMSVEAATLPPLADAWAWAHAQATSGTTSISARLSTAWAPVNVSRLLAARVLTQNTNYIVCLVPTTEVGRNAGLGLSGGTLAPAWTSAAGMVRLPVYDRWEFRTAPDGDFARLARRLEGVAAPWAIGRRIIDVSRPGAPLTDLGPNDAGRQQVIRCALFSPAPQPPDTPSDDARWSATRTADLKAAVERPAVVEGTAGIDPGGIPNLPIVGPRLYAKGQRGVSTVQADDWFADINLKPTNRVIAGLGTRVVAKDQEPLMQAAWSQVGEIDRANRALALAELARNLAMTMHRRMEKIDPGRLLQITRPVAARVRLDGVALTLAGQTTRSATPWAALGGSFRRALRPTGPVMRRLANGESAELARLVATDREPRDFARPYGGIDGIGGLSKSALQSLDVRALGVATDLSQAKAVAAVRDASTVLTATPPLATLATAPRLWKDPDVGFRPGAEVMARITDRVVEKLPEVGRDVVADRSLGGLIAGLVVSGVSGTEALRPLALGRAAATVTAFERHGGVGLHPVAGGAIPVSAPLAPRIDHVVARMAPARPVGDAMFRSGAGLIAGLESPDRAPVTTGFHPRHRVPIVDVGPVLIVPTGTPPGGGAAIPITDRERLDKIITADGTKLAMWIEVADTITVTDLRDDLTAMVESTGVLQLAPTPVRDVLSVTRTEILRRLDPGRTVVDAIRGRLDVGPLTFDPFVGSIIRPIMAAPRFDRPMYQALDSYDREWLVPGMGNLPEPELVTLLSSNDEFTEAFLVGLSDEMGRELLWRNYPTDSRGTYFYRFWDANRDELTQQIHRFSPTRLGSHVGVGPQGQSGRAVVVIRGEIVRRYPDLTVMAMRAAGNPDARPPALADTPTPANSAASLFHAMLPPDIMLAGLDISIDELRRPGWWIVLAEHPQATRFRRSEADLNDHEVRFATPDGLANGAHVAAARIANPTRIAFEAGDFLPALP